MDDYPPVPSRIQLYTVRLIIIITVTGLPLVKLLVPFGRLVYCSVLLVGTGQRCSDHCGNALRGELGAWSGRQHGARSTDWLDSELVCAPGIARMRQGGLDFF